MVTIFVSENGETRRVDTLDPAWLQPDAGCVVWVDLSDPTSEEARILTDVFHFHELAVEDAIATAHHPKVETYDGYLFLIVHGIDFEESQHRFATHDVDFFLGPNYLVTVNEGDSRSVLRMRELCTKNHQVLGEGPAALVHRIVDTMVDNYRPEVTKLEDALDDVEDEVFEQPRQELIRKILDLKRDVTSLRRVTLPQRDVVGRLARREFPCIDDALAYRFRDVHDHLVQLTDQAVSFQDRITGLLDAHLAAQSNQLGQTMRVLTVIATIFMPLTVLTGLFGMNVGLPSLASGGTMEFWGIVGIMLVTSSVMLWFVRRRWWL
jgi:magnesium transporter